MVGSLRFIIFFINDANDEILCKISEFGDDTELCGAVAGDEEKVELGREDIISKNAQKVKGLEESLVFHNYGEIVNGKVEAQLEGGSFNPFQGRRLGRSQI